MAYDESLATRISKFFSSRGVPAVSKAMMGGLVFMVDDKMCVGVHLNSLLARIDPEEQAEALARKGCSRMEFTGRPMQGFVLIDPSVLKTEAQLKSWLDAALAFNPKAKASKRK